jgi:SAM-dependent methyltransferase
MSTLKHLDVYWANAMFSAADRDFNSICSSRLREAGYEVFLPQDASINDCWDRPSPTPKEIFRVDTAAILRSRLLVACIDHECIDCGVACEVGIAFGSGIPIVGLHTDIRQHRTSNRIYRNPYIIGVIEGSGEVVSSVEDLIATLPKYLKGKCPTACVEHFNFFAPRYGEFIERLESWYEPAWTPEDAIARAFDVLAPRKVLEIGCGPGRLARHLCGRHPDINYVGYDKSPEMVGYASSSSVCHSIAYTNSWSVIEESARKMPFDLAVAAFSIHDSVEPASLISDVANLVAPGGKILILDLMTSDLPELTSLLRKTLARPLGLDDTRLNASLLGRIEDCANVRAVGSELIFPRICFPSADDLMDFLETFGIMKGMDLPLGLDELEETENRECIRDALSEILFPFRDQRAFIQCTLQTK